MRILIAEDDVISRRVLEATLSKWGYEVVVTADGLAAWEALQRDNAPRLAILDWMMPGLDGVEICRKVRQTPHAQAIYIILLTARVSKEDLVAGLESGADDYVAKPFNPEELRARINAGRRIVDLQTSLADRVVELGEALTRVKQLQGLFPICSYCKKIRDDQNYWLQVETYIAAHSEAQFSHSVCPECYEKLVKPQLQKIGDAPQ